jgi:hypothetical protein
MLRTIARTLLYAALAGTTACGAEAAPPKVASPEAAVSEDKALALDVSSTGAPAEEVQIVSKREMSLQSAPGLAAGLRGGSLAAPPPAPPPPPPARPAPAKPKPPDAAKSEPKPAPAAAEVASMRAPMLVYTANVTMAVFEVNASLARIEELARELGGFLAKRTDNAITIRVPAQRFDEALKRVEAAGDMIHRNVTAEDVTEEFRDLEVRIKNLRAVRERLTELLAKATKVEESVLIERELERVAMEVDRIEGRMKFLRDRAAFSTITVTFQAKPKEQIGAGSVRLPGSWLYDLGLGRLLRL